MAVAATALLLLDPVETVPLPGPLSGPLHFPSSPSCVWLVIWALLIAALVGWLGRLLWRRLRRYLDSRPAPAPRPPARRRGAYGILSAISTILDRHLQARTYRRGCHDLSEALRTYWEERGLVRPAGPRFTRMTAREIEGRVGDRPATRLMSMLSELQFGRHEPTREDLQGACELATELVSKRGDR